MKTGMAGPKGPMVICDICGFLIALLGSFESLAEPVGPPAALGRNATDLQGPKPDAGGRKWPSWRHLSSVNSDLPKPDVGKPEVVIGSGDGEANAWLDRQRRDLYQLPKV